MTTEVKAIVGIGGIVIILAFIVFLMSSSNSQIRPTVADPNLLVKTTSHKIAADSAKVIVVEFGDYQCPACGQAHPIVKKVLADYQGKINFVFRNFPLPQHKNGLVAAEAAEAAGAQGKFWEMYDKLYETQNSWAELENPTQIFVQYAKDLNLDSVKFEQDLATNKYADIISSDKADGNALGVNATPTFFINGEKFASVLSYQEFKNKIDPFLK